ncbi:MAG: alpha/beta hydrolase [Flavobacteriia bacterium]|jgi:predicted esterase
MKVEGRVELKKQGRFVTIGSPKSKNILFVLHGYGQLVEYFVKNFEALLEQNYFIVAPEATHRFYLNGSSGRVGASWMTKELREQDIRENNQYLEQVFKEFCSEYKYEKIGLLGFSQGGATAARYFVNSSYKIDLFVLWACVFPPDVEANFESDIFLNTEKYFVLGSEDEYFSPENYLKINAFYKSKHFNVINFEGKHKIDSNTLLLLFK